MRVRTLLGCMAVSLSLVSCAQEGGDDPASSTERGVLRLALTAADSSGVQYRLRNAQFEISGYPEGWYPPPWTDEDGGVVAGKGGSGGKPGYPPGYVSYTVSSEDDPDAEFIVQRLVPGNYTVALLNDDWYLERTNTAGDWERVAQAVLLAPRYQYVYVWDGGTSFVNFAFGVDGELIDFRSGELQIGISVEKPGEHQGAAGFGGFGGFGPSAGRGAPIP